MNKEAMQQQILEALSKKLGDGYRLQIHQVLKTNIKRDGLTILRCGDNVSPTIYLESFYKALEKGETPDSVTNEISRLYFSTRIEMLDFDVSPIQDFNFVKKHLFVQLINRHYNTELLVDIPHRPFLDDFSVIVRCLVDSTDEGNSSFLVHDNHLKMWGIESEELLSLALQNTRKLLGVDLMRMEKVLMEFDIDFDLSDVKIPLWVLTNKKRFLGASTVLFDDILKDFANAYGNFYVIFSSVHEVLLLPTPDSSDLDFITAINQSVNDTQVQADEVLGAKAYFYSKKDGFACKG